jgi:hypothetical protein
LNSLRGGLQVYLGMRPEDFGTGFRPNENDGQEKAYGSLVKLNERKVMPSRK